MTPALQEQIANAGTLQTWRISTAPSAQTADPGDGSQEGP